MTKNNRRPPGRPKTEHADEPMNHIILQTALQLFLNQGYQKVSIDDIASACGVTKATVYYYYASKSVLFTEAMLAMMHRIRGRIFSLLKADKPLKEKLFDVAEAHLKATTSFDLEGFIRETKTSLSEKQTQQMKEAEEELYRTIGEAIHKAIEAHEIKEVDPTFAAHAYVALLNVGHYRRNDGNRLFSTNKKAARQIVDFFWDGLKHS